MCANRRVRTATQDEMEVRVRHNLGYVLSWSLLWDLEIILRTILATGTPAPRG
jgi:lipopolysaccharide/colanic/teichoic acid biosynthesis glycosyltransferase